jgi:hypothetical protein
VSVCSSSTSGGHLFLQKHVYVVVRPVEIVLWNVPGTGHCARACDELGRW